MITSTAACCAYSSLTAADSGAACMQVNHPLDKRIIPNDGQLDCMSSELLVCGAECSMSQNAELLCSKQLGCCSRCPVMQVHLGQAGRYHIAYKTLIADARSNR